MNQFYDFFSFCILHIYLFFFCYKKIYTRLIKMNNRMKHAYFLEVYVISTMYITQILDVFVIYIMESLYDISIK